MLYEHVSAAVLDFTIKIKVVLISLVWINQRCWPKELRGKTINKNNKKCIYIFWEYSPEKKFENLWAATQSLVYSSFVECYKSVHQGF